MQERLAGEEAAGPAAVETRPAIAALVEYFARVDAESHRAQSEIGALLQQNILLLQENAALSQRHTVLLEEHTDILRRLLASDVGAGEEGAGAGL